MPIKFGFLDYKVKKQYIFLFVEKLNNICVSHCHKVCSENNVREERCTFSSSFNRGAMLLTLGEEEHPASECGHVADPIMLTSWQTGSRDNEGQKV